MRSRNARRRQRPVQLSTLPEWRRRAVTLVPDLHDHLDEDDTIYNVFFELLPRCVAAHRTNDVRFELSRIYEFAAWCLRHEEKDLWNAAGVAFYEHLVDEPETQESIPQWLEPDIFETVSGLFEARMNEADYQSLCERYRVRHSK